MLLQARERHVVIKILPTDKDTEGVGRAANSAVVAASLAIFILDLISVLITNMLGLN